MERDAMVWYGMVCDGMRCGGMARALLRINGGVPVRVVEDDRICTRQIDAEPSGARRQDEDEDLGVHIVPVHQPGTREGRRARRVTAEGWKESRDRWLRWLQVESQPRVESGVTARGWK